MLESTTTRLVKVLIILSILCFGVILSGCQPAECQAMKRCCEQVIDMDQVGASCGAIAQNTSNAATCQTIRQTINYLLEDMGENIPSACKLK